MSNEKKDLDLLSSEPDLLIDFAQVEEVSRVFLEECEEILQDLDQHILRLEESPEDIERINVLFRKVHTIKGSVGAVPGGQLLGSLAHEFETLLGRIKKENLKVTKNCVDLFLRSSRIFKVLADSLSDKRELYPEELSEAIEVIAAYGSFEFSEDTLDNKAKLKLVSSQSAVDSGDQGLWISHQQMEEFLKISGELLVLKNYFNMMTQTVNFRTDPEVFGRRQSEFSQGLTKICDQFLHQVEQVQKEKAATCFQGLHVLVRQASTELNKTVDFELVGGEVLVDKEMGQDLYNSLIHAIRNSIDHGIEDQFERAVQGKLPSGKMTLKVSEVGSALHLVFSDDGKGLDKERILAKAISSGLVTSSEAETLGDAQIYNLIFKAGFSTRDKVTTMSGRGVGMDIVQSTVKKYGGTLEIKNQPGLGMSLEIQVPAPQHIKVETSLLCAAGSFYYALPLTSVAHICTCDELQMTELNNFRYVQYKGQTVPLMSFAEISKKQASLDLNSVKKMTAVFLKTEESIFALLVDRVESQSDLVVKNFSPIVDGQKGFKGVSILADERVTYVVDPHQLVKGVA